MTSHNSERVVVKELSSSLLDMKFMLSKKKKIEAKEAKKKEAQLEKKIQEKEAEATCSQVISTTSEPKIEYCRDYAKLENLHFGRMSFNGFNKEVEILMEYYEKLRNGELSDEDEDQGIDVNDVEMAETFGAGKLTSLSKKAQTKRERRQENERNDEATGHRFNFKDIRKRHAAGENFGEPEKKFMKPSDD